MAPVRSGIVIANNRITESQGIDVLGAKIVTITGNVMRRIMTYGIRVEGEPAGNQGNTPVFAVTIADNVITDVFQRSEPNPRTGAAFAYIQISGGPRGAGSAGAVPGWPVPSTGLIANPMGSGSGALYADGTAAAGISSPGGGWFNVHDNTLLRTLPASTSWSQWGYGASLWIGDNGDGSGFYSGGIPEESLNYDGIRITGALCHSRIAHNIIQTTGARGIYFDIIGTGGVVGDFDFDGLVIEGNVVRDFSTSGIDFSTPSISHQRITFRNNDFDGDPRLAHANRGTHGSWVSSAGPYGIFGDNLSSGGTMMGNTFRNVATPYLNNNGFSVPIGNVVYASGQPGFSTANKGVGNIPVPGPGWTVVQEDSDPLSPTFAQVIGPAASLAPTTTYTTSGAISLTDGRANLMANNAAAMTLGDGTFDGQVLLIKNLGTATAVVTATIDGLAGNAVSLSAAGPIKDALRLSWSVSAATWIAE